jgi:hypothetical protein
MDFIAMVDILLYLPTKSMSTFVTVMVLWRFFGKEKKDSHATATSIASPTFTRMESSVQISKSLVHRVKVLIKKLKDGETPNTID